MSHGWKTTTLNSEKQTFSVLQNLQKKGWLFRGQSQRYGGLIPSIDRPPRVGLSRSEKLMLERQAINMFRDTSRFFASHGEEGALTDDIVALMVLRHYGAPTRLLDWSQSPYVATYFATCCDSTEDGEIWCFDELFYEKIGKQQWKKWPMTTTDGSGDPDKFDAKLTAFASNTPDWFISAFYPPGFPRQAAQHGTYTMTARFDRDHAKSIKKLLPKDSQCHLYIIPSIIKTKLQEVLRKSHNVWRGPLFPDSAGAADTVRRQILP
jgi:hypothetical protein